MIGWLTNILGVTTTNQLLLHTTTAVSCWKPAFDHAQTAGSASQIAQKATHTGGFFRSGLVTPVIPMIYGIASLDSLENGSCNPQTTSWKPISYGAMDLPWLTMDIPFVKQAFINWLLIDGYIVTYIKPACSGLAMAVGPLINTRDMAPHTTAPWLLRGVLDDCFPGFFQGKFSETPTENPFRVTNQLWRMLQVDRVEEI